MPTASPHTRGELASQYPEAEWRERFIDLISLVDLLRDCIIEASYRPTEDLNAAIALTDVGIQVSRDMITKETVNAKDAHVLALLGLVHIDPLIDVTAVDLERLQSAISAEVVSGALKFPLVWGRLLYDRATELFKEERDYLNHFDTLRLLEGTPQGVFQSGHFLVGPFGVIRRPHFRRIGPATSVPIQHCSDPACPRVHRVQLTTSADAAVNRGRPALNKVLDAINDEPSDWNGFYSDITEDRENRYAVTNFASIEALIGDAFSDAELTALVVHAAEVTSGDFHANATALGLTGKAKDFAETLNRAQLIQLLFMHSNSELAGIVDSAVKAGTITIPGDEIRRPRVNASVSSGSWRLHSQLSRLGVRAVGGDAALPLVRLSALTRGTFDPDSLDDMEELAWILRGVPGDNARDRLETFLRTSSPSSTVEKLILARRANAKAVCDDLGIEIDQTNEALRDSILWKIGLPLPRSRDIRDEYWHLHDNLEGLAKTAAVDVSTTAEGLRQISSDYFVSLERFLFDSLCFATWALLHDHYADANPFVFTESAARALTIEQLNDSVDREEDDHALSSEPVLSAVVQGFIRLSKLLTSITERAGSFVRDKKAWPKFSSKTDLQQFPWASVHPFLDLTPESRQLVIKSLAQVGSGLNDSGILTARNGLLHAKQRIPTVVEVEDALRKARAALDALESIGCVRSTYSKTSTQVNAWGGGTAVMSSHGQTISFSSPSGYEWTNMPSLNRPIYLVQGAVFAEPNEMLRFSEGFDSPYQEYWSEYPRRPEPGNRVASSQSETLSNTSEAGAYTSSRLG
jgi:hypothetical protein